MRSRSEDRIASAAISGGRLRGSASAALRSLPYQHSPVVRAKLSSLRLLRSSLPEQLLSQRQERLVSPPKLSTSIRALGKPGSDLMTYTLQPVIATSIPPKASRKHEQTEIGRLYQHICLTSWVGAGFKIVSVNLPDEIPDLRSRFPYVKFESISKCLGRPFHHQKNPLIFHLLDVLNSSNTKVVGIINADIRLINAPELSAKVNHLRDKSVIIGHRLEVDSMFDRFGRIFMGFDYCFFHQSDISILMEDSQFYALGLPWWDYWFPLALRIAGRALDIIEHP